jgi:hypothetical protein
MSAAPIKADFMHVFSVDVTRTWERSPRFANQRFVMTAPRNVKFLDRVSTHALKVSQDELRKAVDKVGNSAVAVCREMGGLSEAH